VHDDMLAAVGSLDATCLPYSIAAVLSAVVSVKAVEAKEVVEVVAVATAAAAAVAVAVTVTVAVEVSLSDSLEESPLDGV
jgi:hypothetical protein